ncbi:Uncharacterised protein [Mycobacteroides abscessus subsp. abscessus]|nr:Uncharacterised protein [Mycobacteroides abscessus subsp. abscessus]
MATTSSTTPVATPVTISALRFFCGAAGGCPNC